MSRKLIPVTAAIALVLAGSVGLSTPAYASTTLAGCTVTPLGPRDDGRDSAGHKLVDFLFRVNHCDKGRTVKIVARHYQEVPGPNPLLATTTITRDYTKAAGHTTRHVVRRLQNNVSGCDTAYTNLQFRVTLTDGRVFGWTAKEISPKVCIKN